MDTNRRMELGAKNTEGRIVFCLTCLKEGKVYGTYYGSDEHTSIKVSCPGCKDKASLYVFETNALDRALHDYRDKFSDEAIEVLQEEVKRYRRRNKR